MATLDNLIVDVDRDNGDLISGWQRCRQSIRTILTTRLRTRIMRLWWGSEFDGLQDKPVGMEAMARSLVAASEAINLYEPEFTVRRIIINSVGADGAIDLTIDGEYLPESTARRLDAAF